MSMYLIPPYFRSSLTSKILFPFGPNFFFSHRSCHARKFCTSESLAVFSLVRLASMLPQKTSILQHSKSSSVHNFYRTGLRLHLLILGINHYLVFGLDDTCVSPLPRFYCLYLFPISFCTTDTQDLGCDKTSKLPQHLRKEQRIILMPTECFLLGILC